MRTIRLALSIALLLAFVVSAGAQALLTVRVPNATGKPGATVEVPIEVAGAANVGGMHIELRYDADVLQAIEVKPGSLASSAMLESNLSASNRAVIGLIDAAGLNGDGAVAVVVFQVVGQDGDTSPLTLENLTAYDATTRDALAVQGTNGVFQVEVLPSPGPLPPIAPFRAPRQPMTWLYLLLAAGGLLAAAVAVYFYNQRAPGRPPVLPPAPASLQLRRGQAHPQQIDLRQTVTTIGRGRDNHVTVEDSLVSRRHCQIRRQGGEFMLEDLGSTNGTFLNGQQVTRKRIHSNDVVRVGQTELVFLQLSIGQPGLR